jgi:hypothetical protein
MNRLLQGPLGALSISMLLAVGAPASAQISVTANGPYYATPSWSQKLTKNRFVVLADWNHEAVLDRETGLVWQRVVVDESRVSWSDALHACHVGKLAGRFGWRLPTLSEMGSLLEQPDGFVARVPNGHPFENINAVVPSQWFWTSTRDPRRSDYAYAVKISFSDPDHLQSDFESNNKRHWCVRGGRSQDAP